MRYYLNILILLLLAVFANCSCRRNGSDRQSNPAMELYCKYADSTNLTVAYLSDFDVHGNKINTVMVHAEDETIWQWLLEDFTGAKQLIPEIMDTIPAPDYAVEVGMNWDAQMPVGDDIYTKERLSDEEIEVFAQAIISEFSVALNSLLESDSGVHNASIIINDDIDFMSDMCFGMEFKDTTAVKRILRTVADRLNNYGLAYNDTVLDAQTMFGQIGQPSSIMPEAGQNGEDGYIAAVDYVDQTIWVFFYNTLDESINIMKHIRKDLLVFQKIQ